ncbi:hypothetical protein R1sor_006113 [Riccia sorocarpa]|uniref:Uncharacterized protein n=1 Tax=Riccia sorocarpa TaxID=122646 RepID=A0ABD3HLP7_9MARC
MERLQDLIAQQGENPLSWKQVTRDTEVVAYRLSPPLFNYWPVGLVSAEEDGERRIFTFSVRGMVKFSPDNSSYGSLMVARAEPVPMLENGPQLLNCKSLASPGQEFRMGKPEPVLIVVAPKPDEEMIKLILKAVEHGVTLLDTSDVYDLTQMRSL